MKKDLIQALKIITLAVILSVGVSYVFAWTGPPGTPPDPNASAPINVSANDQTKSGQLWAGFLGSNGGGYFAGNVGIRDSSPDLGTGGQLSLDVNGNVGAVKYCDQDGNDCFVATDVGSGPGPGPSGDGNDKVKATSGDSSAGYLAQKKRWSIDVQSNKLQLKNDESSPGLDKYYGTDSSGSRGWWDLPGGDSGGVSPSYVKKSVGGNQNIYCNAGDFATGGSAGGDYSDAYASWPIKSGGSAPANGQTPTGWRCIGAGTGTCYVICMTQ